MQSRFKNYQQIYTDGSKEDTGWLCCYIRPDDSSIFTAEAKAIDLALDFISTCDTCIESNEPHQFKKSTDSETFRKMS